MKTHPIIAIILGIISIFFIIFFFTVIGFNGTIPFLVAVFIGGMITVNISKTNSAWVGLGTGLVLSIIIVLSAALYGVFGNSYELWISPLISGIGGLIISKKKR